jgi:PmbA protein
LSAQAASLKIDEAAELALSEAKGLGCSDVSVVAFDASESQVRFSNNSVTLVNYVRNVALEVYLSKDKKRIIGGTYNPSEDGIKKFVNNLFASCQVLPPSESYAELPQGPFHYEGHANYDPKVEEAPLSDYVKQTIDAGLAAGAERVSGSLNAETTEIFIRTSAGASGKDRYTAMLLNARAFADDNASGQGLSCTSFVSDFAPEKAGRTAGDFAKRSKSPKQIAEGNYNIVFSPTVVANIFPIASSASAFAIESGISFLVERIEQRIGVQTLYLEDDGVYKGGLGGRTFDDEGVPTGSTEIVGDGTFREMLHNATTAKKFGAKTTGNAGIIQPRPNTIVYGEGDIGLDEMIRETKNGLYVTNNWYTRYQNIRTGDYSTVPRDAAFRIADGELAEPIAGIRVSDSIPRQLENIEFISSHRDWIKWWEVDTPTYAPAVMVKDVHVTKAVGS